MRPSFPNNEQHNFKNIVSRYMRYSCVAKCRKEKCIPGDTHIRGTEKHLFKNSVTSDQVNCVVVPSMFVKKQKVYSGKTDNNI